MIGTRPVAPTEVEDRCAGPSPRRARGGARRSSRPRPPARAGPSLVAGLRLCAEGRALRRPHAHDHAVDTGVGGLRAVDVRASLNPKTGQPVHLQGGRLRGHALHARDRPARHAARPAAHWAPEYAAIDELPATFAVRRLVVISIVPQVQADFNYALKVADIREWETHARRASRAGSVVMVRSDWSKRWPKTRQRAKAQEVPGRLAEGAGVPPPASATSSSTATSRWTPTRGRRWRARRWLMHNGYAQAEGVANLDKVRGDRLPGRHRLPEVRWRRWAATRASWRSARRSWRTACKIGEVPEAPLRKYSSPLHWDTA